MTIPVSQLASTDSKTPAQHAAKTMADYCNDFSVNPQEFIDAMSRQHPSLQQTFTGVCLQWLKHLSELQEFQFDGRNEASVQIAKKLLNHPGIDKKYDLHLPLI